MKNQVEPDRLLMNLTLKEFLLMRIPDYRMRLLNLKKVEKKRL